MNREWTRDELRALAREVAAEAPPLSPAQIGELRRGFGFDATPAPLGLTRPSVHVRRAGAPTPTPATTSTPDKEVRDRDCNTVRRIDAA